MIFYKAVRSLEHIENLWCRFGIDPNCVVIIIYFIIFYFVIYFVCTHMSTDHHVVLPAGKLFISSVMWSDVGVYRCVAVNPLTASRRVSSAYVNILVQGLYMN